LSPHSANIDRAKFEQQYGGILARAQPVCARGMEFFGAVLERFRAKWIPVREKKTRQNKNLELRF
jgi:hypothetical protein